jgi:tetratricopeptide (TPR) repeat protein
MSDVVISKTSTPDPSAKRLRRTLRGDLDTIAAKALKKNPQERYASVAALANDLGRYLHHEPIAARPDSVTYRALRFARRHRAAVALAGLAMFASVAGVVGTVLQASTARMQRDFALRQLSRAEALNDLNSFVLSDAAPSGKPFTVNELLGRAERIVQRQHGERDSSRVDLLISIGRQYYAQDEDSRSLRVLEEAYRLSRELSEPSTRAQAACALGSSLGRRGEFDRAEALIQEGLHQRPSRPESALDRIFCLQRGSEVARERGTSRVAIARAQQAQELVQQAPSKSDLLRLHAFMGLAESYRSAGQYREATETFQKASALLTALGRDNTQTGGTLFNNWGLALHLLGRPLEAERVYRRAIAISSSDGGEKSVSPMLLVNYSRVLRDLDRLAEAADYAERGYARAVQAGDQVVINQSLLMRGAIYRGSGDLKRAAAMLSEVEPRLRRSLPAGHPAFASLAADKALVAQARGDLPAAMSLINEAMEIAETSMKAGGDGGDYLPMLLVRRSGIELETRRDDQAVSDASGALVLLQKSARPGALSGTLGRAYLMLARALRAQGRHGEARANFKTASEHLQATLGPDHPDTRSARRLAEP